MYRESICMHVYNNWNNFKNEVLICHHSNVTKRIYALNMLHKREWATSCEVRAAAEFLNVKINVWLSCQSGINKKKYMKGCFTPKAGNGSSTINLLLQNNHYQLLKLKPRQVKHYQMSQTLSEESQGSSTLNYKDEHSHDIDDNDHTYAFHNINEPNNDTPQIARGNDHTYAFHNINEPNNDTPQIARGNDHTYAFHNINEGNNDTPQIARGNDHTYAFHNINEPNNDTPRIARGNDHTYAFHNINEPNNDTPQIAHGNDHTYAFHNINEPNNDTPQIAHGNDHTYAFHGNEESNNDHIHDSDESNNENHASTYISSMTDMQTDNLRNFNESIPNTCISDANNNSFSYPVNRNEKENCKANKTRSKPTKMKHKNGNKGRKRTISDQNVTSKNIDSRSGAKVRKTAFSDNVIDHQTLDARENPICTNSENCISPINTHPTSNQDTYVDKQPSDPIFLNCRKLGVQYEKGNENETKSEKNKRNRRNSYKIKKQLQNVGLSLDEIPEPPPLHNDEQFNKAMDCIRSFELKQMSYNWNTCSVCHEMRIDMKLIHDGMCLRCAKDKSEIKMFSTENNMDPGKMPQQLENLTVIEQQMICRISPCINVHMLKHGGIGSSGHCVTFPQDVNEPAQLFPRLPHEIQIVKVCKQGQNETSKNFRVRRYKVQNALTWLKSNNIAYSDIIISNERLNELPIDGEISVPTIEYNENTHHTNDKGPAPLQTEPEDEVEGETSSSVLLPDPSVNIGDKIQSVLNDIIEGENPPKSKSTRKVPILPWPTRGMVPISEYTTKHFFTLAFPSLFPHGTGDFYMNRQRSCLSMSDWADHLIWYKDGRFASHQYFKFVIHNMIMRKKASETSNYVYNQQLGEGHLTIEDLKQQLQNGDTSTGKKILYFGASIRGTNQYWAQRGKELRSLIQYKIHEGEGLPSFFTTGSCAEFYFKPLKRLLNMYIEKATGTSIDLSDKNTLFQVLQKYPNIVAHYFDLRTQSYFKEIMGPVFNVNTYWYRQEFAKSRGMVHWHGLCWRSDREPHNLLHEASLDGLSDEECAEKLSQWASTEFGLTASHPAGCDETGNPRKEYWPPPEGYAPLPSEDSNPLIKLLMDVSATQETLLEDHLLLSNRFNLHRCSDYCMRPSTFNKRPSCRMEFPKIIRQSPAIANDRNGSLRLEMKRDHPVLVQHSKYHTQGWRANGDISLILSKSDPDNPSVNEILATEKYITGYACKGSQPTGALVDLFNDMVHTSNDTNTAKSLCTKLLMRTVKRDISAVEACYEISSIPLYRCSNKFQSISLSGFRVIEKDGSILTKSTAVDKYLNRDENDSVSLYTFICRSGSVPVITGGHTQATWPLEEAFCRTSLLLHFPDWRTLSDLKTASDSWIDAFSKFLETDLCPNFIKADVERVKNHTEGSESESNDEVSQSEENQCQDQPEWMDLIRPNANYDEVCDEEFTYDDGGPNYDWSKGSFEYPDDKVKSFSNIMVQELEEKRSILQLPDVDIEKMNEDQKFAFNIVMNKMTEFSNEGDKVKPLRLIVSGTAGSGKSFLIKCIVKAIRSMFKSNKAVQVLCPTGNSANLISGVTLHSFLKIPTTNKGKEMKFPDGSTGETLQSNCEGVHALLVDERSLIGANTLGWMEFMCRCGMQGGLNFDKSWGGIPVVVFLGDDVQLPPVLDSTVYNSGGSTPAAIHGALVWKEFKNAVNLKNIVRQGLQETEFKEALMALRTYSLSSEQAEWLQHFQWSDLEKKYGHSRMQTMNEHGLFVFPSHQEVWQHNKLQLCKENEKFPIVKMNAVCCGTHSKTNESDKAGGLLNELFLCKGAKVMLCVNLCVPFGLFNGALGYVVDIIYKTGRRPTDGLPDVVMVNFPNYTGPSLIPELKTIVPIIPVTRKIECRCFSCSRTQIPLKLGWATTIHKCQGMTIGEGEVNRYIVINPGTRSFESRNPGALFVALSRAKATGALPEPLPDFAWHPTVLVNQDRLCFQVKTKTTKARSDEINRIETLCYSTKEEFEFLRSSNHYLQEILNSNECSANEFEE
ncbi:hypothetical protein FSP39_016633 [Pinctada imbricata]|uniref:ATP-dependent DNA helicase n=1 Tax=Pinctada imbricata TaxID=66713 RepID=A0AA88XX43_PINIB|nr:hypothetical protein FSP39_016633 [Pinctada imbricata]